MLGQIASGLQEVDMNYLLPGLVVLSLSSTFTFAIVRRQAFIELRERVHKRGYGSGD
jgi:broad-specificity NMP kinase